MALPKLSAEERSAALEKAAQARKQRAEVKRQLKTREVSLAEVLDRAKSDEIVGKMKVTSLLESLPRVGVTTAQIVMEEVGIAQSRRVHGLGVHQREALLKRFS